MSDKVMKLCLVVALGLTAANAQAEFSPAERALLEFHLFDGRGGMILSPRVTRKFQGAANSVLRPLVRTNLVNRGGIIEEDRSFVGLEVLDYRGEKVQTFSCAMCHAGKAAGQFIPGLGNKTIDTYGGAALLRSEWKHDQRDLRGGQMTAAAREVTEGSLRYAAMATRSDIANPTQGTVPVSWITTWLYQSAGRSLPNELRIPGAVKVPQLWGYGEKSKAGFFCDGMGIGNGWLAAVPLAVGLPPDSVRQNYSHLLELERALGRLQPPPYSFPIAPAEAHRGRAIFQQNCSGCHGSYQRTAQGAAIFQSPHWVPIEVVQTDGERLRLARGAYHEMVRQNPLGDLLRSQPQGGHGYFAPRLDGIWSRFPYLHNGSVPNLAALLTPPPDRPQIFSMKNAGELERFDQQAVGLTTPAHGSLARVSLQMAARHGSRRVYDTSLAGHSNQGHPFGTTLPEDQKSALIEFLKTL